ncbi:hypothetical protein FM105_13780 [Brevibacterium yomogidense]|uniref:Uncharacterized protein n=1 Tax=Brevibacterium yomogidense TaxID=946573 RepID=A0A1X6XP37_9MICO|nr:hypothetical protein FM105_13780 [Brevibacterium yomogidense]
MRLLVEEVSAGDDTTRAIAHDHLSGEPSEAVLVEANSTDGFRGGLPRPIRQSDRGPRACDTGTRPSSLQLVFQVGPGRHAVPQSVVDHGHGDIEVMVGGHIEEGARQGRDAKAVVDDASARHAAVAHMERRVSPGSSRPADLRGTDDWTGEWKVPYESSGDVGQRRIVGKRVTV